MGAALAAPTQPVHCRVADKVHEALEAPAAYELLHGVIVSAGSSIHSEDIERLDAGTWVNVSEVVHLVAEQRVRGKIDTPLGYITLRNTESGQRSVSEAASVQPARPQEVNVGGYTPQPAPVQSAHPQSQPSPPVMQRPPQQEQEPGFLASLTAGAKGMVQTATAWVAGSQSGDTVAPDYRLLLLGATGGGKTSFLNLICNFKHVSNLGHAKVESFMEVHRLELENSNNSMQSQTCDATVYRTYFGDLLVEIIDTPGMVDTRGPDQDKEHMKRIIEVVNKVGSLHLIVVVANGAATRLDPALECALTQVSGIMPAKALPKVMSVYTHVDSLLKLTFDHQAMQTTLGIPKVDFCVIDNPFSLLQSAKKLAGKGMVSNEDIANELQVNFQKANKELKKFYDALTSAKPQLTKGFKELYDMRCNIELTTLDIVAQLDHVSKKQREVQNLVTKLQAAKSVTEQQKLITATASQTVTKWKTVGTDDHNTLCGYAECYKNCHLHCSLTYTPDCTDKSFFKKCAAMGCGGDTCQVCTHSYENHYHNKAKWVSTEEALPEFQAMQSRLAQASQAEASAENYVQQAQNELATLNAKSADLARRLVTTIKTFEEKSNARNFRALLVSQIRLIDTWIDAKQGLACAESMVRDLESSKHQLQTLLNTIDKIAGPGAGVPPPPQPAEQRPRQRQGRGGWSFFG